MPLYFSLESFSFKQLRWISKALITIFKAVPSSLEQSLGHIEELVKTTVGSRVVHATNTSPSVACASLIPCPATREAQRIVLQAWRELELTSEDQSEDCFMFSCGSDIVTALLLSKFYQCRGYDIGTEDIVAHSSRVMQAWL